MTSRSTWKIFLLLCLFLWQLIGCETNDLSVDITADITGPVEPGTAVTLSWSSVNATTCSIEPDVGIEIGLTGSVSVIPTVTTTYTITAVNDTGATVQDSVTIDVLPRIVSFEISAVTIHAGDEVTLTWETLGADACVITPSPGAVGLSGTATDKPSENTTYALTATNDSGDATETVSVSVTPKNHKLTKFEYDGAGRIKGLNIYKNQ